MAKRKIVFRPDKKVDVTIGKETQTFTPEEYKKYNEAFKAKSGFGENAPAVKDQKTTALFKEQEIIKAQEQQKKALDIQRTNISAAERTAIEMNIPEVEVPTIEEIKNKMEQEKAAEFERRKTLPSQATGIGGEGLPGAGARLGAMKELGTGIIGSSLSTAANIYSAIQTAFTAKKALSIQTAEASFTDATTALTNDIAMVKTGGLSVADATRNLEGGVAALNRLEEAAVLKGKANVRYWVDTGAEIEAQIIRERAILERLRADLLIAGEQQRLASVGYSG